MPSASAGTIDEQAHTGIPTAGLTVTEGLAVVLTTTGINEIALAGTTSPAIYGVTREGKLPGFACRVVSRGVVPVQVKNGETWAIGDHVKLAANGQFSKTSTSADKVYGVAQGTTSGGNGEMCHVRLFGHTPAVLP